MEIIRASEAYREEFSKVFVAGFWPDLGFFAKTPEQLADAIAHMFVLESFYIALIDGEIAGITSFTGVDDEDIVIQHESRILRRKLGWMKGTIANRVFRKEFQKLPLQTGPGIANVGFVATAPDFQRQGVAFQLMQYVLKLPGYHTYMLEAVADTNKAALGLYQKLGYQEFRRTKQKHSKLSGINYYIDMKYVKE